MTGRMTNTPLHLSIPLSEINLTLEPITRKHANPVLSWFYKGEKFLARLANTNLTSLIYSIASPSTAVTNILQQINQIQSDASLMVTTRQISPSLHICTQARISWTLRGGGCGVSSHRRKSSQQQKQHQHHQHHQQQDQLDPKSTSLQQQQRGSQKRLFEQNPEPRPESYTSKVANLRDLATFLRLRPNDPLWAESHSRALRAIRIFTARFHKDELDYIEIGALSTTDCPDISRDLVTALLDELHMGNHTNYGHMSAPVSSGGSPSRVSMALLQCVRNVLLNSPIAHLQAEQLDRLCRFLLNHHDLLYNPDLLDSPTFVMIYTTLLEAVHLAMFTSFPKKLIPQELLRRLNDMTQSSPSLAHQCYAVLGLEVIHRLPWKEMKIAPAVKQVQHVSLRLAFTGSSQSRREPLALVKTVEGLEKMARGTPLVHAWYENLKILSIFLVNNLFCEAEDYIQKLDHDRRNIYFCYHLSNLLHDRAVSHYIPEIQSGCIKLISAMYVDRHLWCPDQRFHAHVFKILVDMAKSSSEVIRNTSLSCLTQIHSVIHEDPQGQKSMKKYMPEGPNHLSTKMPVAFEEKFPSSIFEESGRKERNVPDILEDTKREVLMSDTLSKRLLMYIPAKISKMKERSIIHEADRVIMDFLAGPKKLLFIFGDEGAGKTTLGIYTVKKLWGQWTKGEPIPFYISLTTLRRLDSAMIDEALKSPWKNGVKPAKRTLGFSELQIDEFRRSKQPFIFILDSCDDVFPDREHISISKCISQWNCKVIVLCRTASPIRENMTHTYSFYDLDYGPEREFIEDVCILPFHERQRVHFVREFVKNYPKSTLTVDKFESFLNYIPEIKDSIGNPWILFLVASTFPTIYPKYLESLSSSSKKIKISRLDLYKEFLINWNELQSQSLLQDNLHHIVPSSVVPQGLAQQQQAQISSHIYNKYHNAQENTAAQAASSQLIVPISSSENIHMEIACFCTQLAGVLYLRKIYSLIPLNTNPANASISITFSTSTNSSAKTKSTSSVSNSQSGSNANSILPLSPLSPTMITITENGSPFARLAYNEINPYDVDFDRLMGSTSPFLTQIRQSAPIIMTSDTNCEFIHQSLFDYFLSEYLYGKFMRLVPKETVYDTIKPTTSSKTIEEPWQYLNLILDLNVMIHLSRKASRQKGMQKELFNVIRLSKEDVRKSLAASNAITILNFAQVSFTVMDLSGVRIPKANLSRGLFESVNFTGADLSGVDFSEAYLSNAILDQAIMSGTHFGVMPILYGHSNYVWSVCPVTNISQKPMIASASWDKTVRVWDLETGQVVYSFEGHTDWVNSVCYVDGHEGGHVIASGGKDEVINIWGLDSGVLLKKFENLGSSVNVVCSVRGPIGEKWLASGHHDCSLRIRDLTSGVEIRRFYGHMQPIYCLCAIRGMAREKWIASGSLDASIRIWDLAKGKEIRQLIGHDRAIFCLCRLEGPNGEEWIASSGEDKNIWIWDVHRGLGVRVLKGHTESVNSLCCVDSASGLRLLVSCSEDCSIRIWDTSTGTELAQLNGHSQSVLSVCTVPKLPKGVWIASASWDKTIRMWNVDPHSSIGKPNLIGHQGYVNAVCTLDGSNKEVWIASVSEDRTVRVWDAHSSREVARFEGFAGPLFSICLVEGREKPKRLACAGCDEIITLLDPFTLQETVQLEGHVDNVNCVCTVIDSAGKTWLASGGEDRTVRIWDMDSCRQVYAYGNNRQAVVCVAAVEYSHENRWVAFNGDGHSINIWDFQGDRIVCTWRAHKDVISALCFIKCSTGAPLLVSASHDTNICVWDFEKGTLLQQMQGHKDWVRSLCEIEGPFGRKWIASGSYDRTIRIWDVQTGIQVMQFDMHRGAVVSLCMSSGPHGEKRLVSSGLDKTIRIWDISNHGSGELWKSIASELRMPGLLAPNNFVDGWTQTEAVTALRARIAGGGDHSSGAHGTYTGGLVRIIGERRLECRGLSSTKTKLLATRDRLALMQSGAVSLSQEFVDFCESQPCSKSQMLLVARMYQDAVGVEANAEKAAVWRDKAAAAKGGDPDEADYDSQDGDDDDDDDGGDDDVEHDENRQVYIPGNNNNDNGEDGDDDSFDDYDSAENDDCDYNDEEDEQYRRQLQEHRPRSSSRPSTGPETEPASSKSSSRRRRGGAGRNSASRQAVAGNANGDGDGDGDGRRGSGQGRGTASPARNRIMDSDEVAY